MSGQRRSGNHALMKYLPSTTMMQRRALQPEQRETSRSAKRWWGAKRSGKESSDGAAKSRRAKRDEATRGIRLWSDAERRTSRIAVTASTLSWRWRVTAQHTGAGLLTSRTTSDVRRHTGSYILKPLLVKIKAGARVVCGRRLGRAWATSGKPTCHHQRTKAGRRGAASQVALEAHLQQPTKRVATCSRAQSGGVAGDKGS